VDVDLGGLLNLVHSRPQCNLQSRRFDLVIGPTRPHSSMNTTASTAVPEDRVYAFAKIAAAHYVNDFARALAPFPFRMNAVHPTNVNTDMLAQRTDVPSLPPDLQNPTREAAEPVSRWCRPCPFLRRTEDISEAVLFLASDAARYITGQQLRVDGGGFLKVKPWSGG